MKIKNTHMHFNKNQNLNRIADDIFFYGQNKSKKKGVLITNLFTFQLFSFSNKFHKKTSFF